MSAGRRLAKRSIIGTKVCAPGPDGLWYSGVIQDVKTPNSAAATPSSESGSVCADTKYLVRFDFKTQAMQVDTGPSAAPVAAKSVIMEARRAVAVAAASVHISPAQTLRRNAMIKEFRESDLIGPGFRSMAGVQLQPGQRVYFTFNGRETSGDVVLHEADKDEVTVKITAIGTEDPIELKKRLEEVRLLESRRSARLADQDRDTDFARLADMAGDRRRTSHSIDVPAAVALQPTSRKRGPSYVHEDSDSFQFGNDEEMDECNAALILMKLSNSPKSPKNGDKWLGSSPGSSSASWSSGSSSPPLSEEDGQTTPHSSSILRMDAAASARIRTTSVSTSDEGIVMDYNEDAAPRKRRANKPTFKCIWKGCDFIEHTSKKIERHIRNAHLGNKKARRSADYDGSFSESDHEEEFYYTEIEDDDDDGKVPSPPPPSQPTLSHRDMARPPHEDPEYQRQIVGNFKQGRAAHSQAINGQVPHSNRSGNKSLNHVHQSHVGPQQPQMQLQHHNAACMPTSPLAHHNYTWPSTASVAVPSPATAALTAVPQQHSPVSIMKHARCSPRPSATTAPYRPYVAHHHNNHHHQQQQQQQHQYSSNSSSSISSNGSSGGGDSNNTSPHLYNNNSASANSVLQQLSQQNITVTTHQSGDGQQQQQLHGHQQHPLSAVTITPNYQHHATHQTTQQTQQHMRHSHHQQSQQQQQQSTTTASNMVANVAAPNHHAHSPNQHHTASHTHSTHQQQQQHQPQHVAVQHAAAATRQAPNSPNRRTRGENKKCRKVYGMDRRDQWCTQCKWKKACSRFGD